GLPSGPDGAGQATSLPYQIPNAEQASAFNFIAPFLLDPNDPRRLLAGGRRLWVTSDARTAVTARSGPSWRARSGVHEPDFISTIAVARGNSAEIWVGGNRGAIERPTEGLAVEPTWVRLDDKGTRRLPDRWCTRILIDPRDQANPRKHVYLTFGGYTPNNIWETRDGGKTWLPLVGEYPGWL